MVKKAAKKAAKIATKKVAKKVVKTTVKKAAKESAPRSISVLAAHIFAECAFATGQGMERHMRDKAGGRPYALTEEGRDYWLTLHTRSIPMALRRGNNWEVDREIVLVKAQELGDEAAKAALADPNSATSTKIIVDVTHVTGASKIVRESKHCVVAKGILGRGPYCTV